MADAVIEGRAHFDDGSDERRAPLQTRKGADKVNPMDPATWGKISRNAQCPCGSGKKYKHCHGSNG